jgi:hypothetical protein
MKDSNDSRDTGKQPINQQNDTTTTAGREITGLPTSAGVPVTSTSPAETERQATRSLWPPATERIARKASRRLHAQQGQEQKWTPRGTLNNGHASNPEVSGKTSRTPTNKAEC